MGGTAKSLNPEIRIKKSRAELNRLAEKHAHNIRNGLSPQVRESALFGLMDILLTDSSQIKNDRVGTLTWALNDREERVSVTSDLALTMLVKDYPDKVFPILIQNEKSAGPKLSRKISETIRSIYSLSSFRDRVKLRDLERKHGRELAAKTRQSKQKLRRVA
ncbi:hypothetical protein GF415_04140 [Candidatus Micrarchaeota archaeon]|nr:hypothetical protein [Candidatus Micrarchaeota archaeon]